MANTNTRRGFTQISWVGQAVPDNAPVKGHRAAFTLIELLVVVLIIGILAAVALPQYKFTVEKSRSAEALTIVNSLQKAVNLYVLTNGYSEDAVELIGTGDENNPITGKLDIDVESVLICDQDGGDKCRSKNFEYDTWCNNSVCYIRARRKQNGEYTNTEEYQLSMKVKNNKWTKGCFTNSDYPYSEKICKSLQAQGWGYNERI